MEGKFHLCLVGVGQRAELTDPICMAVRRHSHNVRKTTAHTFTLEKLVVS
jgi:hypothetical protein